MKYQVATITITQNDIDSGLDTAMHNPVARALARDLSLEQGVFVATDRCHAFEMQAPYRTISLSQQVTEWLKHYCQGDAVEPLTFNIVLEQAEQSPSTSKWWKKAQPQEAYVAPRSTEKMIQTPGAVPPWQAPSLN